MKEAEKEIKEIQENIKAKNKKDEELQAEKFKKIEHEKVMDKYRGRKRINVFLTGLLNFVIIIGISTIMFLSSG